MEPISVFDTGVTASIEKLNQLLINLNMAKVGIDDKMMRQNVIASIAGMGEMVDRYA